MPHAIGHTSFERQMEAERYSLVRTIASGGMGQVYEALARGHGGFSRRVAIKRMLPELLGDDSAKQLFREEARVASHLHHSNIVQVLDYGVVDGAEFLVLEYVDGIDGHRLVRKHGKLPVPIALHVISELAEALAYAHARTDESGEPLGIVHRDVSAHNVLLSWEGDVKLSDFGIALVAARDTHTKTGMVKGKVGYMAPEQLQGRRATPASDVYALGITLQVLVTGMPPGDAVTSDLAVLPEEVRALLTDCTHDHADRRPSASEVAARAMHAGADAGRAGLRTFLATVRTSGATPRSALDDLMGLALVAAGPGVFTISKQLEIAPPASAPEAETARAVVEPPPPAHVVRPLAPRARRRRAWAALASVAVLAAVAFVIMRALETPRGEDRADRAAPNPVAVAAVVPVDAGPTLPVAASPDAAVDAMEIDAGKATVAAAGAVSGAVERAHKTPRGSKEPPRPSGTPDAPVPPPPPPPSTSSGLPGCIVASGRKPGWNGATLVLSPDLRSSREPITAPARVALPAGHYAVRLTGIDGTVLVDREIDVPPGTTCASI